MLGVLLYLLSVRKPRANYPMRLTENPAADVLASWSPDGSKIAFASNRDGKPNIYVMNADGSSVKRLTTSSATDDKPTWSPLPFNEIAFTSGDRYAPGHVINVINMSDRKIRTVSENVGDSESAAFAPNGRHIAFVSTRWGKQQIAIVDRMGRKTRQITKSGNNKYPAWSSIPH